MKLGVLTNLVGHLPLEEALDYVADAGVDAVEISVGNFGSSSHCNIDGLLSSKRARDEYLAKFRDRGLTISAISAHGNPLHPNKTFARDSHAKQRKAIRLARLLDVEVVNGFSGCPGDGPKAKYPNWVTCPWPPDFLHILEWQWSKKVIPYWSRESQFLRKHGRKFGFEMHPGFCVYNTETLLKVRDACGDNLGANFDPSHLFWQGMDPIVSLRGLAGAVYHVHAKDCRVDPVNAAKNGVLDTKHYGDEINRSWIFRTVGYGHGPEFWKDFVSTLRLVGYDHVLSIEHEDSLMSVDEGFKKAVAFLRGILLEQPVGDMWWA